MYHKIFPLRKCSPPGSRQDPEEQRRSQLGAGFVTPRGHRRGTYKTVLYPNGEFGIGYCKPEKKLVAERKYDKGIIDDTKWVDSPKCHELEDGTVLKDWGDTYQVPNKLVSGSELSQPTKKYGIKGISAYGKKIVRNCAFLLQKESMAGRLQSLQFGTLTLPSFPDKVESYICSKWNYLTKRFFEECTRIYRRSGIVFRYVSVTEIQPERWAGSRQVGLHLHFVYPAYWIKDLGRYVLTDNKVREIWVRLLKNILHSYALKEGVAAPSFPTPHWHREKVRKSAAGYLGKYMSKGGKIVDEVVTEKGEHYVPSQWWSADKISKVRLSLLVVRSQDSRLSAYLLRAIKEKNPGILYAREILLEIEYTKGILKYDGDSHLLLGYGGRMSRELLVNCKQLLIKV